MKGGCSEGDASAVVCGDVMLSRPSAPTAEKPMMDKPKVLQGKSDRLKATITTLNYNDHSPTRLKLTVN